MAAFVFDVAAGAFPDDDHSYGMKPEEAEALQAALKEGM